jgi:hypothetical protein
MGAKLGQIDLGACALIDWVDTKATLVLRRLIAVCKSTVDAYTAITGLNQRKVSGPSLDVLTEWGRASFHSLSFTAKTVSCSRCAKHSLKRSAPAWVKTLCQALSASKRFHPSHALSLRNGLIFCIVCGSWSKALANGTRVVNLGKTCKGRATRAGTSALKALVMGTAPKR